MPPDPFIFLVTDVHDRPEHLELIQSLNDPLNAQVACEAQADSRTIAYLARMIGDALGKQPDRVGAAKNSQRHWEWVRSWLVGHQTQVLIVNRAQNLNPKLWRDLFELAAIAGFEVVLVVQSRSRGHREMLDGWPVQPLTLEDLRNRVPSPPTPVPNRPIQTTTPTLVGHVPTGDDFTFFLSSAYQLLSADEFAAVRQVWASACAAAVEAANDNAKPERLLSLIYEQIRTSPSAVDTTVRLRGIQFGLLGVGLLLTVNDEKLTAITEEGALTRLDDASAALLLGYSSTYRAALAALAMTGEYSHPDLARLCLRDVRIDEDDTHVGGMPLDLPWAARVAVSSHLVFRVADGATDDDRFFEPVDGTASIAAQCRTIQHALRGIGRETGLRLTRHWNRYEESSPEDDARRLGIKLVPLTGPDAGMAR